MLLLFFVTRHTLFPTLICCLFVAVLGGGVNYFPKRNKTPSFSTRMHSSRMRTAHFSRSLSCTHALLLPRIGGPPPPIIHTLFASHVPHHAHPMPHMCPFATQTPYCHACPPLPCLPYFTMHIPTFTTHAPPPP